MSCNCKVNRQLDYLHKKYGNKIPVSKRKLVVFNVKEILRAFLVFLILIPLLPLMFLQLIYMKIRGKNKISVKKLVKFGKS